MEIEIWCKEYFILNVAEDIDVIAKDVQHLLRYDILSFMVTCDTSNILATRDL